MAPMRVALVGALAGATVIQALGSSRVPIIVDTDLGQDMDDIWSIWYLLASPNVEVKLIVTASRCTRGKAELLAKWLTESGHSEIPIAIGIPSAPPSPGMTAWCNGTGVETGCEGGFYVGQAAPYIDGFDLKEYRGAVFEDGVKAIAEELQKHESPALVALAPFTNLAALQVRYPAAAARANVFAMAGSVKVGYRGRPGANVEYNVLADAPAAQAVFRNAQGWRSFAVAPTDSCGTLQFSGRSYLSFRRAAAQAPKTLAGETLRMYDIWQGQGCDKNPGNPIFCSSCLVSCPAEASDVLFDVQPSYMVVAGDWWNMLETQEMRLDVNASAFTVESEAGGRVNVTLGWKGGGLVHFEKEMARRFVVHDATVAI